MEKTKYINFTEHILPFVLTPLIILVGFISYYRFMVKHDYMVSYEGECDPAINKCFIGCEDDECNNHFYYSKVYKYAPDLYRECGQNITDCEAANECLPEDQNCSIVYCDFEIDGDACFDSAVKSQTNNQLNSSPQQILKNNSFDKNII